MLDVFLTISPSSFSRLLRNLKLFHLSEIGFTTCRQNLKSFLVSIINFPDFISDCYLDEYDCREPKMIVFALVDLVYMVGVSSHAEVFKKEIWYVRL